jgi:hypothetical protein
MVRPFPLSCLGGMAVVNVIKVLLRRKSDMCDFIMSNESGTVESRVFGRWYELVGVALRPTNFWEQRHVIMSSRSITINDKSFTTFVSAYVTDIAERIHEHKGKVVLRDNSICFMLHSHRFLLQPAQSSPVRFS